MIIAVALSGGVDSAVAAALLKKQGHKVVGFFMKNWSDKFGLKDSDCPWHQDRQDAMQVAAKLDIPFHTLDFEKEYKEQVLDYFFREYKAGRTPNPDVFCNSQIKFGVFLEKAMELGANYIATGHYARLVCHPDRPAVLGGERRDPLYSIDSSARDSSTPLRFARNDKNKSQLQIINYQLLKAIDNNKDQTYFLYRLNQEQLSCSLFPIGGYTKPEVRKLAKKFGLPNHNKPDSQGVCFVGHLDLRKFLSQKIKDKPGNIVTIDGQVVGKHRGLFWYTIGQRKGIEIGGIGPFYVVEKDLKKNQLIVTNNRRDERLYKTVVEFNNTHWINPPLVETRYVASQKRRASLKCAGRIRYREPLVKCQVEKINRDKYRATFAKPVWAAASGQSVVFYGGNICLGGGIIK